MIVGGLSEMVGYDGMTFGGIDGEGTRGAIWVGRWTLRTCGGGKRHPSRYRAALIAALTAMERLSCGEELLIVRGVMGGIDYNLFVCLYIYMFF